MKSKTRLDSAVFQLTPTRTRCDLVIIANGVTEKIASGLVNPFLAHLKTAQDQVAKGGYSITLQPKPGSDAAWFTKGIVQRFVRFVSTPEILERVCTIEFEILQIEKSIIIQSNEIIDLNTHVDLYHSKIEDHQRRLLESSEGTKSDHDTDTGKAIVLYKPDADPPESYGSTRQEENSKVQLLKVLETRKAVLQKEQGMAFARAVAAGFEMDHISNLIGFGECFGATRLMEACIRFVQLWKEKHEKGQWLEIDSAETTSNRSDLSTMITPAPEMSIDTNKQNDTRELWPESNVQFSSKSSGNASSDTNTETQVPSGNQEYLKGQYHYPMFLPWPIHSSPGAPPVFQPYPVHGMPFYQNYPGNGPYYQPSYPPTEDPRLNSTQRVGLRRQTMESKDSNTESEPGEMGFSSMRSEDASDQEPHRKAGRLSKKQTGMVVIRNINYIASKKQDTSESESESASDPGTDGDFEDSRHDAQDMKRKNTRSSNSKIELKRNSYGTDERIDGQEAYGGNWQEFQKFLLRNDDKTAHNTDHNMFSMEKEAQVIQRNSATGTDPIIPRGQVLSESHEERMLGLDTDNRKAIRMWKGSTEELVASGRDFSGEYSERQVNVQFTEIGGRGGYRRATNDDFMIHSQEHQYGFVNQSDPLVGNELERASDSWDRGSSRSVIDESFVVPLRSGLHDQIGTGSRIDMDVEFPSEKNTDDSTTRVKSQIRYEPEDLSLILERGIERESIGYDPAVDYEMQVKANDVGRVLNRNHEDVPANGTEGEKNVAKDKKLKSQNSLEKRKTEAAARKGKPSKLNPSTEAQARAAKLRAFKADLQKMKQENEEEERKRLEALKRERQQRIASRANSSPAQSHFPSPVKPQPRMLTKFSPNSHKGSKFSDSEPGSSPAQRLPSRTTSVGFNESEKIIKHSRLSNSCRLGATGLSRSVSSLPELKKEKDVTTPEPKISTARIRRLSEPKTPITHHAASVKLHSPVSKSEVSDGPETKKISAILSLDKTKAATLSELRIRTTKDPSDMIQNKIVESEIRQKTNAIGSSGTSESNKLKKNIKNTSHDDSGDANTIIEKSVVMLEREIPPIPSIQRSEEMTEIRKVSYGEDKAGATPDLVPEYAAIRAPISPEPTNEFGQIPSQCQFNNQLVLHEVNVDHTESELQNISSISIVEKSYQAPYARSSSKEDPDTKKLEHPTTPMTAISMRTAIAQVSDFRDVSSLEECTESLGKLQGREQSKGFKRLLKFGRKTVSPSAGERSVESDKLGSNGTLGEDHSASATTYEVHTLKNLISQDETPTASSSHKASRHFSLLSPFRSKTNEKKLTT